MGDLKFFIANYTKLIHDQVQENIKGQKSLKILNVY